MPFRELVESSPDLVAFFDGEGRVRYLNEAGRALVGMPAEQDVTATTVGDYLAEGARANVEVHREELATAERLNATNLLRHWQGGEPIPVEQSTFRVHDEDGRPVGYGTVQRDRRRLVRAEEALSRMSDVLVVCDPRGRVLYATPSTARTLGYEPDDIVGADLTRVIHPDDRVRAVRELSQVLHVPGASVRSSLRLVLRDGTVRHVEAVADDLSDVPTVGGVIVVARDVTEQRRSEQAEHAQARVLELIATGAPLETVLDELSVWLDGQVTGVRASLMMLDGDDTLTSVASPSLGESFRAAVDGTPLHHPGAPCALATASGRPTLVTDMLADERWSDFHGMARQNGLRSCWSFPVIAPGTGSPLGAFALYGTEPGLPDASVQALMVRASHLVGIAVERRDLVARLAHEASHDLLTGLPNRKHLLDRLEDELTGAPDAQPVVMFLDLDRLKVVNDSLGHELGDELLVRIAARLREAVPAEHLVARFGGDEFVVLACGLGGHAAVEALVGCVLDAVAQPVVLAEREITPAASVGVVRAAAGQSASDVLRDADIAMYRAKGLGGAQHAHFGPAMRRRAFDRLDLEGQLRLALEAGDFRLRFQPVLDLLDGSVVGFEALVRWRHPQRGMLAPRSFIDVAEETGLIVPLGEWVLEASAEAVRSWCAQAPVPDLWVSVNVSAAQLGSPSLAGAVRAASEVMAPWRLGLELTESTLMVHSRQTRSVLAELAALGIDLSIDDFGTGYSSLSYLTRLPFGTLKIDRSFVADLESSPEARTVAEAVVRLGDGLRLTVIAEGVETEAQRDVLRDLGCRFGQGYLLGRPAAPADALAMLRA